MLRLTKSTERWWQKPLAEVSGRPIPAELAVLYAELQPGERGAWLNSRGTTSGATDLVRQASGRLKTKRQRLPIFVSQVLKSLYETTGLVKGAPDLVIWNEDGTTVRFVEVKCPHWDQPSAEQIKFMQAAEARGFPASIAEWEFAE